MHTHTHTHSAVKISTNPVYYLPPLCTLPLFFILSLSHFLPRSPLLLFFLSLLLKPILVAVARTHRLTHTLSVYSCDVCWPGAETRKQGGECWCVLLFSSSSSVHVLQRELPSLCLCEGAAAFTICAADTVAGVCVCVCMCVCASLHVHVFPCVCACFCKTVE